MATAELPFDPIEAKLAPPALRADTVVKAELIERLRASPARVLTVVAPAGFGKTTLLAQMAARDERAFATVALDERDDDPVVLLRYVAVALSRVAPVPAAVFEALATPGRSVWTACIPRVCAALAAVPDPIVLVLEDVHFVRDPASHDAIAALVDHVPEHSRIVLVTREELALPIARLRVQGRLLEVGSEDLRLDAQEAAVLLAHAGVDVDAGAVLELTERTEGWPAGLYLAALSLKAGGSAAGGIRGDDRLIADYLRQELLSRLSAEDVRFLTRTSVLERMNGSLCDALLLREDSANALEALERSNRFLVPLDRTRTWYRYHHLFRDLLRSELGLREPDMAAELSRRAMAWCQANALPELALHYAHQAGATDTVAQLLERLALPTYFAGRVATLETWFDYFDDDGLRERYPTIAVLGAWVHYLSGRPEQGALWEHAARTSTATPQLPDGSASIAPWIATLRTHTCPDGIEQMLEDAQLALEQSGPRGWWRPAAQLGVGVAHLLAGETERAQVALKLAAELAAAAKAPDEASVSHAELALAAMESGAWEQAASHADQAMAIVERAKLEGYLSSGPAGAVAARVALHDGRVAYAREVVARLHRLRPLLSHGLPWLSVQTGLELTRVHLALGEPGVAAMVLGEAEAILRVRPRLGTLGELAEDLRRRVAATSTPSGEWALSLTAAELRLLPLLTTHLGFPQIGERLFLSRTTIKTQAISIYRKFGVSSRAEAIERAVELGLLEDTLYPARARRP